MTEKALDTAKWIGSPLLVKAVAGGGAPADPVGRAHRQQPEPDRPHALYHGVLRSEHGPERDRGPCR